MSPIIYKDEDITIKKISDSKIQVEKWIPVYVCDMFIKNVLVKSKLHAHYLPYHRNKPEEGKTVWERLPDKKSSVFKKLSDQYQTPLKNIDYETKDYDIGGLEISNDISSIIIDNENLKRDLKLKMVLE
jgi:hypothetical protein